MESRNESWPRAGRLGRMALACGAAILACGCSARLHEPGPHRAPDWHHESWRVHCESARTHAPAEGAAPGVHHVSWVWASDEQGREIRLSGELEDGFLSVRGIKKPDGGFDPETRVEMDWLRARCLDTLTRHPTHGPLELGRVTAARLGEHFEAPILLPAEAGPAPPVRRLVVFGDSLSDTGLLKRRLHVMPDAPYWMGRFSNGPIWIDYLEALTPLAVQNHARGGAAITRHDHLPGETLIDQIKESGQFFVTGSTGQQIDDYIERVLENRRLLRPEDTAFVIWGGANDYISKEPISGTITSFLNSPKGASGYRGVANEVITALEAQIRALVDAGALRIAVGTLPDLGETPIVLQNESYSAPEKAKSDGARRAELSRRFTELAIYHNEQLESLVASLQRELPDVDLVVFHPGDVVGRKLEDELEDDLARFEQLGFHLEPELRYLAGPRGPIVLIDRCYRGPYHGTHDASRVCSSEARALFWDVVHPTTYLHCWEAWSISRRFAQAGWIEGPQDREAQRLWCGRVSDRTRGSAYSEWILSPD